MHRSSRRTIARNLLVAAVIAAGLLLAPGSASAEVTVQGTGEPEFTSSSQNTQFVSWRATSGSDAYRLRAVYLRDSVEVTRMTHDVELNGSASYNWSGVASLEEGHTYAICVTGLYSLPNDNLFFQDGPSSCTDGQNTGKRTSTTIDRSKPVTSIQLAGGADATGSTLLPVSITYQDGHSQPYPANFLCVAPGNNPSEACADRIYGYDAGCSRPAASNRTTTFECRVETSGITPPDGRLFACVTSADSAVPDNPTSPDQTAQAGRANLSEKTCDSVILDRAAPAATIRTPSTTVNRGQGVAFEAEVSDVTSGIATDTVRWVWNDGTPATSGGSVTHAFAAAGTYTVQLEVADAAGNKTVVSKEITVVDPATGGVDGAAGCDAATKKLAKAKTKLGILKRGLAAKGKIKQAKVGVKRAKAARKAACSV